MHIPIGQMASLLKGDFRREADNYWSACFRLGHEAACYKQRNVINSTIRIGKNNFGCSICYHSPFSSPFSLGFGEVPLYSCSLLRNVRMLTSSILAACVRLPRQRSSAART